MNIQQAIAKLIEQEDITGPEMQDVMRSIMQERPPRHKLAAFWLHCE